MKWIVGLGNPGKEYKYTRHNLGFLVIEALAKQYRVALQKEQGFPGFVAKIGIGGIESALLQPVTFMNGSGGAVVMAVQQGAAHQDILVVCDDFTLPFGQMRIKPSGSAGGHNGLKSIIERLGSEDFPRLRLGVGQPGPKVDPVDYVLSNFTPAEKKALPDFINHALDCVTCWVTEGAQVAMNRFN